MSKCVYDTSLETTTETLLTAIAVIDAKTEEFSDAIMALSDAKFSEEGYAITLLNEQITALATTRTAMLATKYVPADHETTLSIADAGTQPDAGTSTGSGDTPSDTTEGAITP